MFDKAIESWFYDCGDIDMPEKILDILEDNAIAVYKWANNKSSYTITDCGIMSAKWKQIFNKNGIRAKIINGFYEPDYDPESGMDFRSASEHVWIELFSGCIFDPTAGQFKGTISLSNYWLNNTTRAY